MITNDTAIPILPSRSLPETVEFYHRLGFEGDEHPHGNYAILRRGSLEIHFFAFPQAVPAESIAGCYLRVGDVAALHQDFAAANLPGNGIPRMDRLEIKPWGMNEFAIVDPSGNLIRVGSPISS
jgi:catechol 2,3-dioxygenase-like lactoylglutathione lyase family enzyme